MQDNRNLQRLEQLLEVEQALESVRKVAMSMTKSSQLHQVVAQLNDQLGQLGLESERISIAICHAATNEIEYWSADWHQENTCRIKGRKNHIVRRMWAVWKNQIAQVSHLKGLKKENFDSYLLEETGFKSLSSASKRVLKGMGEIWFTWAPLKYGYLEVIGDQSLTEDQVPTLRRFAQVFEHAYTRFLDLKKVEVQARDAKIEAALDRVRAASMAMHSTEELPEVVAVIFDQLSVLGVEADTCQINLFKDNSKDLYLYMALPDHVYPKVIHVPYKHNAIIDALGKRVSSGQQVETRLFSSRSTKAYFAHMLTQTKLAELVSEERKTFTYSLKRLAGSAVHTRYGSLVLGGYSGTPLSAENLAILQRMAVVFEQTYRRFLDIQTAEANAREAEIEVCLERVRSAALAMQHTDHLQQVMNTLGEQFEKLGIENTGGIFICLNAEMEDRFLVYGSGPTAAYQGKVDLPFYNRPIYTRFFECLKQGPGAFQESYSQAEKIAFFKHLFKGPPYNKAPKEHRAKYLRMPGRYTRSAVVNVHTTLFMVNHHGHDFTTSEKEILRRFARVFEQSYIRFLDLQKAEAQAREAEIEAALERIRAASMAMHKSRDLQDIIWFIFKEIRSIGIVADACFIQIDSPADRDLHVWLATPDRMFDQIIDTPYLNTAFITRYWKSKRSRERLLVDSLSKSQKDAFYKHVFSKTISAQTSSKRKNQIFSAPGMERILALTDFGGLLVFNFRAQAYTSNEAKIIDRFTSAFEQTYARFLDLQKAEVQAREAQIQAAMESIRASAMAMHSTDDLPEVAAVLRDQLSMLGQEELESSLVQLYEEGSDHYTAYYSFHSPKSRGQELVHDVAAVPWKKTVWSRKVIGQLKQGHKQFSIAASRKMLSEWYEMLAQVSPRTVDYDRNGKLIVPDQLYYYISAFSGGFLSVVSYQQPTQQTRSVLNQAAETFDIAYRRYLDLTRAESQAREAQIETGLEKVRSASLAMQSTSDLQHVVDTVFVEMNKLDIGLDHSAIVTLIPGSRDYNVWVGSADATFSTFSRIPFNQHTQVQRDYNGVIRDRPGLLYKTYTGTTKREYSEYLFTQTGFRENTPSKELRLMKDGDSLVTAVAMEQHSGIQIVSYQGNEFSAAHLEILKRFTAVFEQAFIRFNDLQRSEAQAREALRDAAADRVRAQIASMRTAADLEQITPLIWKELTTLHVPFFRCGVFIIDDLQQTVHAFLSTPVGASLSALKLPYQSSDIVNSTVEHWRKQKTLIQEWDTQQVVSWTTSLAERGLLDDKASYQGHEVPPKFLALHFVPFAQGMIYVGSPEKLNDAQLEDVNELASAFSVAYARYEDFNRLEKTLAELQSTQNQLIQSEKMASLGELTAGIAHEIQNPLNFVNNFSEVSGELLFEIEEELEKPTAQRDDELIEEIIGDLRKNLSKITHHGGRASGIVKGMLDHSRTSSGEKTPTDINQLVDEYLRLAYHGLRAKDNTFQAKFTTSLYPDLPLADVIAQDIGRVILNLINNAFYTVHKKKIQLTNSDYQPEVKISTGQENDVISIRVQDNGQGIPPEVVEKIFQPFFTTKPTGEGTGLGLSLSYDIVTKGHGGTLTVESEEGVGTAFEIALPGISD